MAVKITTNMIYIKNEQGNMIPVSMASGTGQAISALADVVADLRANASRVTYSETDHSLVFVKDE